MIDQASLLEKGILVSPEVFEDQSLSEKLSLLTDRDLDEAMILDRAFLEKKFPKENFKVTFSYNKKPKKLGVVDFVSYFNKRFEALSGFLRQRQEFQRTISINRLKAKTEREGVSLIGLVFEKAVTKKNSIILTLEDPTGTINVIVRPDKAELYAVAKDIVLDELIGVEGFFSGDCVFANQIFSPEVPSLKELKKGPVEEYVICLGDLHFGSNVFLKQEFEDFIEWINQKKGSDEQREIASKTKYLLITGDLVEGVGVYPGQEKDLAIKDIKSQYDLFTGYLKRIPPHITIFICPGNHDAGRISEPQPPIFHKYAESLQLLPNIRMISNPGMINIGAGEYFPGFDFLIYHGYSLIYYADHVDSIRAKGGQKRPDLIMKFLLQKRHLAPTHTSNLYIPDRDEDPMVINKIPDFFVTGHIHRMSVNSYKNITLLNCSCWTAITEDQEKRGLQPQPAKVAAINLKSREIKVINFMKETKEASEGGSKVESKAESKVVEGVLQVNGPA
jgi:DNA polymerase II small subunit